jgi:hypothetical protein
MIINRIPRNAQIDVTTANITGSGTVTSSSGTASSAVDGNGATYCQMSGTFGTQYVQLDMGPGVSKRWNKVRLYNYNDSNNPSNVTIKVSNDGVHWVSVKTQAIASKSTAWYDISFNLTSKMRYIRFYVNSTFYEDAYPGLTGYQYQRVQELQFYGG